MIKVIHGFLGSSMQRTCLDAPTYTELCEQANELARCACHALNDGDVENARIWSLEFQAMFDRASALLKQRQGS